ncbi:hypothetical protein SAMN04488697_10675 [Pseudomonas sp. 43mfcvi1.1]|nr:hypothetical protein ATJ40_10675 [Pseudomonas sp. 43mfcvi1.1]SSB96819.1 hypothetical protein SAMN04488697_10675 [Pseudomonas sp. 43mfcvi1.1]
MPMRGATTPLVGASLLAMAVGQLVLMLNVTPSSRAGSLPQLIYGALECTAHRPPMGASLLAMAVGQEQTVLALSIPLLTMK